ncbi:MAG: hypothetical protein FWD46_07795 [Cystobacterineae bacterium]|nr:hypothetical protein [Cystobacterineae bacterium]
MRLGTISAVRSGAVFGSKSSKVVAHKGAFQSCIARRLEQLQQKQVNKKEDVAMGISGRIMHSMMRMSLVTQGTPKPQLPTGSPKP